MQKKNSVYLLMMMGSIQFLSYAHVDDGQETVREERKSIQEKMAPSHSSAFASFQVLKSVLGHFKQQLNNNCSRLKEKMKLPVLAKVMNSNYSN